MKALNHELKQICQRNRDGSFAKQSARERILTQVASQLHHLGFKNLSASSLKPKHVDALLRQWKTKGLASGTIKNRMCELRWWAEKVGRRNVIARNNDHYDISKRVFVTNISKARDLEASELEQVADPYTRMSLRLQAEFGLRREESLKIRPAQADQGDHLLLQASWTKGGRERQVPLKTAAQRVVIDDAKHLAGAGSLIPTHKTYIEQLRRFEYQCGKAGIDHVHGHRHAYAQRRYLALTGQPCPAAGGRSSKQLTLEEKKLDREARLMISQDLGHEREQITAVYLSR